MGVTVSHTTLAPVSLASTLIGFISFAFTLATFLKVFWQSIITLKAAPDEITDYLSNLKQALLEERRHLRKVRRRARKRSRGDDGGSWVGGGTGGRRSRSRRRSGGGGGGGKGPRSYFERDEQAFRSQGESEALRVMRDAIRDMIRSFRVLEYPFLKPEFQDLDSARWSTNTPREKSPAYLQSPPEGSPWEDDDGEQAQAQGLSRSNRYGSEYKKCGMRERWLWLHRKGDVVTMSEGLSRIEVRRTAHEVGAVAMAVTDIGRDVEGMFEMIRAMEGRLN
ncbi:uncharacterized protein CC84DRAFT_1053813, partial [Paraphaeosphaeria sporulosa]